ncbi:MAG: AAA family ATPase [Lachnospiraceae bacterium]|nr:AAA family ATPase [Lachnospiraceae bacterium]
MGKYLNVGNAGFVSVRKGKYVDKTGLISYINTTLGTMHKLTCVSRPRRFGKSFAAKMLCAYYDKSCDSGELFEDLKIAEDESYEKYLNKYDVIYLDISLFIASTENMKDVVSNLQVKVLEELRESYKEVKQEQTLYETLSNITDATGNKFIIIIDEWDALFREAKNDTELQKQYIKLLRSLFKSSLTDKTIEAAYMTGILPIKKYGTQSALTDFEEYTMLQPEPLEEYVGFTEEEVISLCEESTLDFSEIKSWYDGYILGNDMHVYSPKSVLDAMRKNRLGSYWTQTETYESLKIYIDMDEDGLKESIVQMLGGASCKIDIGTFQNDMTNMERKDDVLTLLVHLGYLTYHSYDKTVSIPNEEVKQEFVRAVMAGKHKEIAKLIRHSEKLFEETLNMNGEAVAGEIEKAHSEGTSPHFYNNEQALRSVIKFAYLSLVDDYVTIEELPTGKGYADIVYLPKAGSHYPILLVELKWNKTEDGAIGQIKKNNYPQVLEKFEKEILLVGINYDEKSKKHTCVIEKYKRI